MAKNIKSSLADTLNSGNTKQKALLVCMEYTDRISNKMSPNITAADVEELINSCSSYAEKSEYNKWVAVYNTYTHISQTFSVIYAEYRVNANSLLIGLRQWEDYSNEVKHLNYIIKDLKNSGNDAGVASVHKAVSRIKFPLAELALDNKGYVKLDVGAWKNEKGQLLQILRDARRDCHNYLVSLKTTICAIEDWTKRMKSKAFIPPSMVDAFTFAKHDYALFISPSYSEHWINSREEAGEDISDEERLKAIYPDYEKITIDDTLYKEITDLIEEIYANEKQ